MPQRPSLDDIYGAPQGPTSRPPLESIYRTSAGGFDLDQLDRLEKEFNLKTPTPAPYEPLPTPWDLVSKAPKFITEPARNLANKITAPAADRGMLESYARGAVGGGLEGLASLFSPVNVAATASGLGAEAAAVRGMTGAASVARGVNIASAVPAMAEGAIGVSDNPGDWRSWAELGMGSLGAYLGAKSGRIGSGPRSSAPAPPEPLTPGGRLVPGDLTETSGRPMMGGRRPGAAPEPLRPAMSLDEIYGGRETLTPGGPPAPSGVTESVGRRMSSRSMNEPLRPGVSLDDLYAPEPLTPGTPWAPATSAVEPVGRPMPNDPRRAGSPPRQQTPQELTEEFIFGRGNRGGVVEPQAPLPVPEWAGQAPDARPRMPGGSAVQTAQEALGAGGDVDPALARFFGLERPAAAEPGAGWPPAADVRATRSTLEWGMLPEDSTTQAKLLEFFGLKGRAPGHVPAEPLSTEPAVPSMTAQRLRSLIEQGDPMVKLPAMKKLPPDWDAELGRMTDELDSRPFVRGEGIDVGGPDDIVSASAPEGWRDSSASAMQYPAHPDYPNLIRHTPGAPVFHDIMQGRGGTRSQVMNALERVRAGGRQTSLTDRALEVAQTRLLPKERDFGNLMPEGGRVTLPGQPEGARPPALPEVGGVGRIDLPEPQAPGTIVPSTGSGAPTDDGIDQRIRALWEDLVPKWAAEAEKQKGDPFVVDRYEPLDDFARRVMTDPPKSLYGAERKIRKAIEAEQAGGGDEGFASTSALGHVAGAGLGAAAGAANDREHPWRGAIAGAGMGLAATAGLSRIARPGRLNAISSDPPVSRALQRIMDADAMGAEELRPRAYSTAGGRGTYTGEDIPRTGKFNRADYPNLASEADVKADVDRLTAAGAPKPTEGAPDASMPALERTGAKEKGAFDLGSDAGFVDVDSMREAGPKIAGKLEQLGYFSMLGSPSTVIKGHLGPLGALFSRAAEETVAGRPDVGGKLLKNLFSKSSRDAYMTALHEGSADPTATRWGATDGVMGMPSRLMAAPDAAVTEAMLDAGIPLESAKRSAFTGEPRSHTGQVAIKAQRSLGPLGRTIAFPFARTAINITERGIERTPGLGLLMEMFQKNPDELRDVLARQALGAGAAGLGYAAGGDDGASPYATAALGPYAIPALLGMAGRKLSQPGTPGASPASRALKDVAHGTLSQSPLPTEGYQIDRLLDPRQWPTRFIPRALSMWTDPSQYQTPGPLDPTIARIPGLNDLMLTGKPRQRESDNDRKRRPARGR